VYVAVFDSTFSKLYLFIFKVFKKKDIQPCPPNMIFPDVNYAVKVFPYNERFPI